MRTIVEDQIVSEIIDREGATYQRLEHAFEALKWWLSHSPESGEPIDDLNWLFKQNGDLDINLPDLIVIYTFDARCVALKFVLVRLPIA